MASSKSATAGLAGSKNGTPATGKNNGSQVKVDHRAIEDTVLSLRRELREVYETLREKNEQLVDLEKDVRDRDISIRYLNNEYRKLKEYYQTNKSDLSVPPNFKLNGGGKADENGTGNLEDLLQKLQKEVKEKDLQIRELNQKVIRLSNNLIYVQKESLSKDDRIDELQNEIDKFRQVVSSTLCLSCCSKIRNYYLKMVSRDIFNTNFCFILTIVPKSKYQNLTFSIEKKNRILEHRRKLFISKTNPPKTRSFKVRPITKALIEKRCSEDTFDAWSPGVENTRVLPPVNAEPRMKRQAISAEPLSSLAGMQGDLIKIPKTSL